MIPSFLKNFNAVLSLSPLYAIDTWLHVGLGVFAEVTGFWFVLLWLIYNVSRMRCATARKYMTPVFVIWIIVDVTGALVHLLQMILKLPSTEISHKPFFN
jgi:hypothetical protein